MPLRKQKQSMSSSSTKEPIQVLGGISPERFFADYWQKKPLLIRQAFPDFECPISADELAGLALEGEIESRIIIEHGVENKWELKSGPFVETDFQTLPETHWTLLVQQLDAWSPEINQLKDYFRFVANWRIDDIMASYAPVGGSVGPHFDHYDVFLLQAEGHRNWKLGQHCDELTPRLANTPLSIIENFVCTDEWTLSPGDMLYLPPKLAHFGVATDECITLSIGFRAPRQEQLLDDFGHFVLDNTNGKKFYEDPDAIPQQHAGEISTQALDSIDSILDQHLSNPALRKRWFLSYISETKNQASLGEPDPDFSESELEELLTANIEIKQNEGSRFVYITDELLMAVDGKCYSFSQDMLPAIQTICQSSSFYPSLLPRLNDNKAIFELLLRLIREGSLYS
jgi:50S ribosomal protein L16 3-hydroxylase